VAFELPAPARVAWVAGPDDVITAGPDDVTKADTDEDVTKADTDEDITKAGTDDAAVLTETGAVGDLQGAPAGGRWAATAATATTAVTGFGMAGADEAVKPQRVEV
jgi:hypothetical protein